MRSAARHATFLSTGGDATVLKAGLLGILLQLLLLLPPHDWLVSSSTVQPFGNKFTQYNFQLFACSAFECLTDGSNSIDIRGLDVAVMPSKATHFTFPFHGLHYFQLSRLQRDIFRGSCRRRSNCCCVLLRSLRTTLLASNLDCSDDPHRPVMVGVSVIAGNTPALGSGVERREKIAEAEQDSGGRGEEKEREKEKEKEREMKGAICEAMTGEGEEREEQGGVETYPGYLDTDIAKYSIPPNLQASQAAVDTVAAAKQRENGRRIEVVLNEADVEESFTKGSGSGGQKINKTCNRVVLVHTPTGEYD